MLDANRSLFSAAFLFSAINSILALTVSFYMLQVYNRVLASCSLETLAFLTLIATAALAVFELLDMLRAQLLARIGIRVGKALGGLVLQACVAASPLRADPSVWQGLRDTDALRIFLSGPAAGLMDAPFPLVFLLLLLTSLHGSYFLTVLAVGMALAGIAFASDMTSGGPSARAVTGQIEAQSFADDSLRNTEMLKGMDMSAAFARRWRSRWLESQTHALTAADRLDRSLQSGPSIHHGAAPEQYFTSVRELKQTMAVALQRPEMIAKVSIPDALEDMPVGGRRERAGKRQNSQ